MQAYDRFYIFAEELLDPQDADGRQHKVLLTLPLVVRGDTITRLSLVEYSRPSVTRGP
jgi:hypothetical protein